MNALVKEWMQKAEADYRTASREITVEVDPNWDAVCFHCEQSTEKFLKGLLQRTGIEFSKTHDLEVLLRLALQAYPALEMLMNGLKWLTVFAVAIRYPGEFATKEDAEKTYKIMKECRAAILPLLERE